MKILITGASGFIGRHLIREFTAGGYEFLAQTLEKDKIINDPGDIQWLFCDLKGGKELVDYFDKLNFTKDDFRGKTCNRLKQLELLKKRNKLNDDLEWL